MLSQIAEDIDPVAEPRQAAPEMRALEQDKNDLKGTQDLAIGKPDAYKKPLRPYIIREGWKGAISGDPADLDEDKELVTPDAAGLIHFLKTGVLPWYVQRRKELENRPQIRAQAFVESLDPNRLERLGRYEVHLDRKLERTLATQIRLQDLRKTASPS